MIDAHHNNHASRRSISLGRRLCGAFNLMACDGAVLARWAPIQHELRQGILIVFLRMLFPIRIGEVEAISSVEIFVLNGRKEFVDHPVFRIKAEEPPYKKNSNHNYQRS